MVVLNTFKPDVRIRHPFRVAGILALIFIGVAIWRPGHADDRGTATVSITPATQYTDNTPIPPALFAPFSARIGTCSAPSVFGTEIATLTGATAASTAVTFATLPAGSYCFQAFTNLTDGAKSDPSVTVTKTVAAHSHGNPKPPLITVTTTAYVLVPTYWGKTRVVRLDRQGLEVGMPCGAPVPDHPRYNYVIGTTVIGRCG